MRIIDISLPLENGMWSYRPEWTNSIRQVESVLEGGKSTVYNFNLHSHTGTYIETCEHKFPVRRRFEEVDPGVFYGPVLVIRAEDSAGVITLQSVQSSLPAPGEVSRLIIYTGYGLRCRESDYLSKAPCFEPALTEYIAGLDLKVLGVDSPIIENRERPYSPVNRLFEANNHLLLLAPLRIDPALVPTGNYVVSCFPLPVKDVSGALCRALLFDPK